MLILRSSSLLIKPLSKTYYFMFEMEMGYSVVCFFSYSIGNLLHFRYILLFLSFLVYLLFLCNSEVVKTCLLK